MSQTKKRIHHDDLLRLRCAAAEERESQAVVANIQLSFQRESAILQDRSTARAALMVELQEKYGISSASTIDPKTGDVDDPTPPAEPAEKTPN